jgi:glutathione S-transferase
MMKLLSNALSPYGRKVKLTIAVKSLGSQIEMVIVDTNPGTNVEINSANPLGKIPSLVLDDKKPIFDSNVICEYLDSLKPAPVLFPRNGPERWQALALGSLADGILDAALLLVYEKRFRPEEKWHAPWQQAPSRPRSTARSISSRRARQLGAAAPITAISRLPAPSAISISGTKANGVPDILSSWPGSISTPRRCRPSKRPSQGNSRNLADFPIKPSNVPFGVKRVP